MVKKTELVNSIMNSLLSSTENNFQSKMTTILEIICEKEYAIKFEKVGATNGDGKNDGWIPERNIYFAFYSPTEAKISQINSIEKKLKSDLDGLCEIVYNDSKWGGKIDKFYLIVNTHDKELPADPDRKLINIMNSIKNKYNVMFDSDVLAAKNIKNYLIDLSDATVKKISDNLDVNKYYEDFSIPTIYDFVEKYSEYLVNSNNATKDSKYVRIKIEEKIRINDLEDKENEIKSKIIGSEKIERYLSKFSDDVESLEKYELIKNHIVDIYTRNKTEYKGVSLYNKILDELLYENMPRYYSSILEACMINIFIKCDIFEKEK